MIAKYIRTKPLNKKGVSFDSFYKWLCATFKSANNIDQYEGIGDCYMRGDIIFFNPGSNNVNRFDDDISELKEWYASLVFTEIFYNSEKIYIGELK